MAFLQIVRPTFPNVQSERGWHSSPPMSMAVALSDLDLGTYVYENGSPEILWFHGSSAQSAGRRRHGIVFGATATASGGAFGSVPLPRVQGVFGRPDGGVVTPLIWGDADEWQDVATETLRPPVGETHLLEGPQNVSWILQPPSVPGGQNTSRFAEIWAEIDWRDRPTTDPWVGSENNPSVVNVRQVPWSFGLVDTDGLPVHDWSVTVVRRSNGVTVWEQSGTGTPPIEGVTDPLPNDLYDVVFDLSTTVAGWAPFPAATVTKQVRVMAPLVPAPSTFLETSDGQARLCWWSPAMEFDNDDVLIEIQRRARCGGVWDAWETVASLPGYGDTIGTPNLLRNVFFLHLAAGRPEEWVTNISAVQVVDGFPGENALQVDVSVVTQGDVVIASPRLPVPSSGTVTASAYVRTFDVLPIGSTPGLAIRWRNAAGTVMGMSPLAEVSQHTGWGRVVVTAEPPNGAGQMELVLVSGWFEAMIEFARPQLELGPVATGFMPGADGLVASGCWDDLTVPVAGGLPGCHDEAGCCVAYRSRWWGYQDGLVTQSEWSLIGDVEVGGDPWYGTAQLFTSGSVHSGSVMVGQLDGRAASAMMVVYIGPRQIPPTDVWREPGGQGFTKIFEHVVQGVPGMLPRCVSVWLINSGFDPGIHTVVASGAGQALSPIPAYMALFPLYNDPADPRPFEVQDIQFLSGPGNADPTVTLDADVSTVRFGIIYGDYDGDPPRQPDLGMQETNASSSIVGHPVGVWVQQGAEGTQDVGWIAPPAAGVAVGIALGPASECVSVPTPSGTDWLSVPHLGLSLPVCPDLSFYRERPVNRSQPSTGGRFTVTTGPPSARVYQLSGVLVTPEELVKLETILGQPRVFYRPAEGPGVWTTPDGDVYDVTKVGRRVSVSFDLTVIEPFPTAGPEAHYV